MAIELGPLLSRAYRLVASESACHGEGVATIVPGVRVPTVSKYPQKYPSNQRAFDRVLSLRFSKAYPHCGTLKISRRVTFCFYLSAHKASAHKGWSVLQQLSMDRIEIRK